MTYVKMIRSPIAITLLAMSSSFAFAQSDSGSFEQTLEVDGPIVLDVSTGAGEIDVRAGPAGEARVHGSIQVRTGWFNGGGFFNRRSTNVDPEEIVADFEANPPVELSGGRLRVGYGNDGDFYGGGIRISYEITVPADTEIDARTGSGSMSIAGIQAPVEAATGSGSVRLDDIDGDVRARSGSGGIRAEGVAGDFEARTGSGSVELVQTGPGDVIVSTGSGSSRFEGIDGSLRARAGSGTITVDGRPSGPWDVETGSGSIRMRVPDDAAFDVDVRTGSGGVSSDHPITIQGRVERNELHGQVRGGGPVVRARAGSGSVSIE
jgi:Toastrack DUF4097